MIVDGNERTWNRAAVPDIVKSLDDALEAVKGRRAETVFDSEQWESMPVWANQFDRQIEAIHGKIEKTQAELQELASEAQP